MGKKILVVDDDPMILKLVQSRLEANQYTIVTAGDGDEALIKVGTEKPDLIILDIQMPKMDGYTFLRELKKSKDHKNIPVVVLTAKDKMQDLFKLEGVKNYIVKPFETKELLAAVKQNLQHPL